MPKLPKVKHLREVKVAAEKGAAKQTEQQWAPPRGRVLAASVGLWSCAPNVPRT
jgi:hypothetical protein